ncbi:hypothetical protein ACPC54_41555 [Kitasatospora sp. NPDC094028]
MLTDDSRTTTQQLLHTAAGRTIAVSRYPSAVRFLTDTTANTPIR